ncbi:bifunctional serine/threonine-protein kinase/formylglycine-generating enzyme family protein [Polyangium aurulentum]|uniref:bifunctional serine/threonine-protein kinase/formylglycine-generating enzyme family protein n=1 Tax=Polyangium aurulentum TaxID=2567896 RepID=UPI0010AEBE9F|nr:bifunctional serine/threonine-protein kinase/formylglycine-generating enzyme family protein [Polyangium aurulentum]UQA55177.1 SUMF1/EgtB/PvdO family nonheme iron enzyme [Polyangium aurulentum]
MTSPPLVDPFAWVGQTLGGKYRVDAVLGEGGFGVVYRAQHLGLGEPIAIKCLKIPPGLPPEERERFHQSFLDEGRLLRKLSRATASVVQALDVGAETAPSGVWTPYLVLEWLRGETLEELMERRAREGKAGMPLAEAARIMEPAALAMATAHGMGVVHRDLKPANLFLAEVGGTRTLKVLDFGIAKVIADNASITRALESTGATPSMFTPHYGAPEQFNRRFGATGPWTDVYALALLLVELASGKQALEGDDATQLYIATTDVAVRPTPRARGVRTSDAVERVFQKALAIEPRGRFTSARGFWDALTEALAAPVENAAAELPPTIPTDAGGPRTTSPQGSSPQIATSSSAPRTRKPLLAGVAAVAVGALLAAGIVAAQRYRAPQKAPAVMRFAPELGGLEVPAAPEDMVLVPAGRFVMGHAKEGKTERPPHTVTISKPFFMDRVEVTAGDYARCVAAGKCTPTGVHGKKVDENEVAKFGAHCTGANPERARHPINCVDQGQAAAYCAFVGKRLPTEAEWEYAARGTDERLYPWGNEAPTCEMGNFARAPREGCAGRPKGTIEVGSFPGAKSASGVLDMAGNVWEWVADGWDPSAYARGDRKDPLAPQADNGVLRGGSWDFSPSVAKTTFRLAYERTSGHVSTGFRCAKTAE